MQAFTVFTISVAVQSHTKKSTQEPVKVELKLELEDDEEDDLLLSKINLASINNDDDGDVTAKIKVTKSNDYTGDYYTEYYSRV